VADVLVARNREGTSLPYLIRVPLSDGIVLKARETWPCTTKVYCHRAEGWPADAEIVERIPVRYSHRPRPRIARLRTTPPTPLGRRSSRVRLNSAP